MPEPVPFPESNTNMVPGDSGAVYDLPVFRAEYQLHDDKGNPKGSMPTLISRWLFTTAEMDKMRENGGHVYLEIISTTQPPVSLHVDSPFKTMKVLPPNDT